MDSKLLTIGQASKMVGVSIQTLRRWDDVGRLPSVRKPKGGHRHYRKEDVENYIKSNVKDLFRLAKSWITSDSGIEPRHDFYCSNSSVFQARLSKLENDLGRVKEISGIFPLIVAIAGEIGNNSFDHNLGNWPDIPGIFFAYDLKKKEVILADRGQGVLKTLKRIKPELANHQDALMVAFTEIISGRAPESRGNGLKFVREVVVNNEIRLFFQTGDARLKIQKDDSNLDIKKTLTNFRGCLARIKF
ncbi:MAG: hypothetical protein AUJ11_03060 [Parcubacteria group bacterium CG1_02_44_65]|uniref:HTH merR-type domain-containing protein n=2 Tax=Candidatus Portnoyibacteriota TaxID=1817913 RepID=A0A2M7YLV8_9BACT|nr:MAG: hypothetical protein AUJ11_03060 [Parcubacteria group bacterium CG1_02_44_65]PIZ69497.1 MAG: hypothetical protein COY10_01445 [Candidatus Portnoybacteria bacterium CG_4_10_14_0_2_um_filter_43_36]PJA63964.1 MAG: hypothetical protein CO160_01125 [Candidatus Portnoybacteria bacterium CG_4_9_14_3_um_filter_43_11]